MKSSFYLLHKNLISAYGFFVLTALAYFCGRIYTVFTHGQISESLSSVWLFLLLFGTCFRVVAAVVFTLLKRRPRKIASDIYDSGVITYTSGMTMRGIFEIFSADKTLVRYYEIAGIGLMTLGFMLIVVCSQKLSVCTPGTGVLDIFIAERTVERAGARVEAGELYSLHNKWARENGYFPLSRRKFIAGLKSRYSLMRFRITEDYTVMEVALRD